MAQTFCLFWKSHSTISVCLCVGERLRRRMDANSRAESFRKLDAGKKKPTILQLQYETKSRRSSSSHWTPAWKIRRQQRRIDCMIKSRFSPLLAATSQTFDLRLSSQAQKKERNSELLHTWKATDNLGKVLVPFMTSQWADFLDFLESFSRLHLEYMKSERSNQLNILLTHSRD